MEGNKIRPNIIYAAHKDRRNAVTESLFSSAGFDYVFCCSRQEVMDTIWDARERGVFYSGVFVADTQIPFYSHESPDRTQNNAVGLAKDVSGLMIPLIVLLEDDKRRKDLTRVGAWELFEASSNPQVILSAAQRLFIPK